MMDLQTLLGIRASESANVEALKKLYARFADYVGLLQDFEKGIGSVQAIEDAQHTLVLRLREGGCPDSC
jgi:hypothetical protein